MSRHHLRCLDCLTGAYVEDDRATGYHFDRARCDVCGGPVRYEGTLTVDNRLAVTFEGSPCDFRCTDALGKVCDCSCRGKNHGTRRVVTYVVDAGAAPRIEFNAAADAICIAVEYRAARQALRDTVADLSARRAAGEYLPRPDFDRLLDVDATLAKARKARTHKGRMSTLRAALDKVP